MSLFEDPAQMLVAMDADRDGAVTTADVVYLLKVLGNR